MIETCKASEPEPRRSSFQSFPTEEAVGLEEMGPVLFELGLAHRTTLQGEKVAQNILLWL